MFSSLTDEILVLTFQVSLLLKDSFIDSFPSKDRPFIKVILYLNFKLFKLQYKLLLQILLLFAFC